MHVSNAIWIIIFMGFLSGLQAQQSTSLAIPLQNNEKWWGGFVGAAAHMPFDDNTPRYDLSNQNFNNQNVPLLLSSTGRYIWSEQAFRFQIQNDTLYIHAPENTIEVYDAGKTLRDAYLTAAAKHFSYDDAIPAEIFFQKPQYNTWIELMYNQNQADILAYAQNVLDHDFPTGIFMVDDNWQRYYGNFHFKSEKFNDPKAMVEQLHQMGFKIMLWVCPFYSPDMPEYREMRDKGYLLKEKNGNPAIIRWWNGQSACLDVTNPDAVDFFKSELRKLQEQYGIDGFKFDAGDVAYMVGDYRYHDSTANANIFSQRWAEIALDFPFNELRTTWKTGGQPLVQRLGDKRYSWNSNKILIPGMTTAGLLGFAYSCPDMIGGGEYKSFLNLGDRQLDEELIVRSCQIHAMMPMMQFSVAPWRVLSKKNTAICAKYARLHESLGDYILACAKHATKTNEPIVRSMEYQYPHQGFINCQDQFMLGERYMVAPMVTPGYERNVQLPKGRWKDDHGEIHKGGQTITIDVPIERLPYFEKMNE